MDDNKILSTIVLQPPPPPPLPSQHFALSERNCQCLVNRWTQDSYTSPTFLMLYAYMYLCDFVIPGFCIQKNSQRCKIISGTHPAEHKHQLTDQNVWSWRISSSYNKKILNKIHNNNNNDFILVSMYLALQLGNWGHFPMYWQTNLLHDF